MKALKVETQQKIIEAAREVFIEKGLQGARMQEIADRAAINKALLHYYYRSKEQLFDAVFDETVSEIIPKFAKVFNEEKTMEELMLSFFTFYNNFFRENPYMPQFFFHEIWQNPDKLAATIKSQNINPIELVSTLKDKIPPFYDSEFLPQHIVSNVMGMCLFPHIARPLFQRLFFDNDTEKYDKFLSERTDLLMSMLSGFVKMDDSEKGKGPDEDF
jgi:TetR/AcrR family transcriptional regulator